MKRKKNLSALEAAVLNMGMGGLREPFVSDRHEGTESSKIISV